MIVHFPRRGRETTVIGTAKLAVFPRIVGSPTAADRGALNLDVRSHNPPVEVTYTSTTALAKTSPRAAAGKLWRVRRDRVPDEPAMGLPPGYSLEAEGRNQLVLRRADGSGVCAFAVSAFGPTPEAVREAAEEDRLRRRGPGSAGNGDAVRDG